MIQPQTKPGLRNKTYQQQKNFRFFFYCFVPTIMLKQTNLVTNLLVTNQSICVGTERIKITVQDDNAGNGNNILDVRKK